ncbi:MAG: rubredoxin-like domain-containing protein [Eisenbergiella massiliensis]
MKKIAVRNIRLCTKDCLCLYVCPTGAADTENSIIDVNKCIGCGVCAQSCPSGAISMVPTEYPPQQPKEKNVADALYALLKSKTVQERIARQLAENGDSPVLKQLAEAIAKSNRLMAEDILREAGYMLPQSGNTHRLLQSLLNNPPGEEFPKEAAERLLELLPDNDREKQEEKEEKIEKWRCTVCGYIHEGPLPEGFTCPRCKQPASVFVKV